MNYLGILFAWMKFYHITKNTELYKKIDVNIVKYSWTFYLLKIMYPIWLTIGIFTGNIIFIILSIMSLIKFFIYPLIRGKTYRIYELIDTIICIIFYLILIWRKLYL